MTDQSGYDDEHLMRQIAKRQPEALSSLYDRYGRLVFGLALRTTGDSAAAEEIAQDVFVRAWENAGQYRPNQGTVRTWLASIARHRSIDHLRRLGARAEAQSVSWDEIEEGPAIETPDGTPEQLTETAMLRAEVRGAVAELPEEQKQVLALAYFRGFTQGQIAIELGLPLGTVKTRIRLAMDKLRVALGEKG